MTYDGSSRAAGLDAVRQRHAGCDVEVVRDNLTRTIIPNGDSANPADQSLGLPFGKRLRAKTP